MAEPLTASSLPAVADAFGVDVATVRQWRKQGMPGEPRAWPIKEIERWKLREIDGAVATLADVGQAFGVSERTAAAWGARGMPGEHGRYVLAEIAEWREEHIGGGPNKYQEELMRVRAARETLKLQVEQGLLVDVDEPRRVYERHINLATTVLEELPDRLVALLPQSIDAATRTRIHKQATRTIDDTRRALASALEEEAEHGEQ